MIRQREVFAVGYLNRANKVNQFEIIGESGINVTVADPRIILGKSLEENVDHIIVSEDGYYSFADEGLI